MNRRIEIVGGGLAGLSLGLALQRAKIPVTVFEAGTYPRHRVCGEFLCGLDRRTCLKLGLEEPLTGAVLNTRIGWYAAERVIREDILPEPALGLSRFRLDARLAGAFVEAGGDLRPNCRVAPRDPMPGTLVASGRVPGAGDWIGLKVHAAGLRPEYDLEFHLGDSAYVGLSRIEDGRVNLCGLFRRRPELSEKRDQLLAAYLRASGLNRLAVRLEQGDADPASFCGVAALRYGRNRPRAAEIRLGDGYAAVPPFTGNGMAAALQGAAEAVDPLSRFCREEQTWEQTCRQVNAALRRRLGTRLLVGRAIHRLFYHRSGQHWILALNRMHLLPFRLLFRILH